jgi:hypothetical protein
MYVPSKLGGIIQISAMSWLRSGGLGKRGVFTAVYITPFLPGYSHLAPIASLPDVDVKEYLIS